MRPLRYGVTEYDPGRASPGFTLISPGAGRNTYLLGLRGQIVHQWALPGQLGNYAQLLPGGNLLVTVKTGEGPGLPAKGGAYLRARLGG